ncbi:hypothetical protein [Leucobacter musarum]|uniref:hypothetical protein n=1 Tax=Leucobacter musarum TaxID=1930747 RepID=UPI000AAD72C3|nr:hypothetical protein [Leucobacter musarum]
MSDEAGRGDAGSGDARLAIFRAEWPRRVAWSRVRAVAPQAFRQAALGGVLIAPAAACTLLWTCLVLEMPVPLVLPGWLEALRGLFTVVGMWLSIMLWLAAVLLLRMPSDTRRGLAFAEFAERRGLRFARYGITPPEQGVLFGEAAGAPAPPLPRRLAGRAPAPGSAGARYRSEFWLASEPSMWHRRSRTPIASPDELQLGLAVFAGGKNDPRGPLGTFRFASFQSTRPLPHLFIDARRNGRVRAVLRGGQQLELEGDFGRHFVLHVPSGYERDALELLTPDVMACLIDLGRFWDVEIVEDRVIVASTRVRRRFDRAETTALLRFAEIWGAELAHQVATYSDPRAPRPRLDIDIAGKRLRRRSAVWNTAIGAVVVAALLAFPWVLGAILD